MIEYICILNILEKKIIYKNSASAVQITIQLWDEYKSCLPPYTVQKFKYATVAKHFAQSQVKCTFNNNKRFKI